MSIASRRRPPAVPLLRQAVHRGGGILVEAIGVALCRLDGAVTELLLHEPEIELGGAVEERGVGVPARVDGIARGDAYRLSVLLEQPIDRGPR